MAKTAAMVRLPPIALTEPSGAQAAKVPPSRQRPWAGWLLFVLIASTLVYALWQRLQGGPPPDVQAVLWQQQLRFEDRPNGDVGVVDARSGQEIARFAGEQGFVRGVLRALARERLRRGIGPEQPFELLGHAQGRLTLRDPVTGERIALESFGPSNAALFARLQTAAPGAASSKE